MFIWNGWAEKETKLKPLIYDYFYVKCMGLFSPLYFDETVEEVEIYAGNIQPSRWKEEYGRNSKFITDEVWDDMTEPKKKIPEIKVTHYQSGGNPLKLGTPFTVKGIAVEIHDCAKVKTDENWERIKNNPGEDILTFLWEVAWTGTGFASWFGNKDNRANFVDMFMKENGTDIMERRKKMLDGDKTTLDVVKDVTKTSSDGTKKGTGDFMNP